ncbi:MAG: transposase [Trichodesmium sp. MAG_R04]|nr:transposase [Trichodesmium sp. MAG_R04]
MYYQDYILNHPALLIGAGWGQSLSILTVKTENIRQKTITSNQNGTSQDSSNCVETVPKELLRRIPFCPHCDIEMCRNENEARNIKYRTVIHPVLGASKGEAENIPQG